jgi:hypothetical protein
VHGGHAVDVVDPMSVDFVVGHFLDVFVERLRGLEEGLEVGTLPIREGRG